MNFRVSTIGLAALLVVSLSLLVSAGHACWESRGSSPAEQAIDFVPSGGALFVTTYRPAVNRGVLYSYSPGGGWIQQALIDNFNPQAIGQESFTYIAGRQSAGCVPGVGTCAKIKKKSLAGAPVDATFTISDFTPAQIAATNFLRFVTAGSNAFLVADQGIVFQKGLSCGGAEWCGKQVLVDESFTAYAADGDGLLLGTNLGGIFRLSSGHALTEVGFLPGAVQVDSLVKTGAGEVHASAGRKIFHSTNNGASWTEIGSNLLPADLSSDLVEVSNAARAAAIYATTPGSTHAFTNTSTSVETYSTSPQPSGTVRLAKDSTGVIWALSLGSEELFEFKCAASPSIPDAGADFTIPFGSNFSQNASAFAGSSPGHEMLYLWELVSPAGMQFRDVFQTVNYVAGDKMIQLINSTRNGTYTLQVSIYYSGFPTLRSADLMTLTVQPPLASGADRCAGITCGAGQTCNPATGLCEGGGVSCSSDSQCPSNQRCSGSRCLDLVCPGGSAAIEHQCVELCASSATCGAQEICAGDGFCRQLTCPTERPVVIDHECVASTDLVQCSGQLRNTNRGLCCSNVWIPGAIQCPVQGEPQPPQQPEPPSSVPPAPAPDYGLAVVIVLLIVLLVVAFFVLRRRA